MRDNEIAFRQRKKKGLLSELLQATIRMLTMSKTNRVR